MWQITYTSGRTTSEGIPTLADALAFLRTLYSDAVFYSDDSLAIAQEDDADIEDLCTREGARILCWEDEASSVNDPGVYAVASITWIEE